MLRYGALKEILLQYFKSKLYFCVYSSGMLEPYYTSLTRHIYIFLLLTPAVQGKNISLNLFNTLFS